tara:strand:- start:479 stop:1030 length:552 start_codon:yes stop_codon:yes gene_type:complete
MDLIKNISLNKKIIKLTAVVIFGSILLAISSKIQTPFTLVPATMQTFVVLFIGMALGYKLASITIILYLFEGSIGLPFFAKGGGIAYLMGPTGGYLIGFIFTAYIAGKIKFVSDPIIIFGHLIFAVSISYILGLIGLWKFIGFEKTFKDVFLIGAQPFLAIEIYKILILTVLSNQIIKIKKFI